jgi:hypothetical protein
MEALAQLVNDSLARYGVQTTLDYRRLQWSEWLPLESALSVLLVPGSPGIFALAEEAGPAQAVFQISEAGDLGVALGRMFMPGSGLCDRLQSKRCFVRYAVIEDKAQRQSALAALQQWLASPELAA